MHSLRTVTLLATLVPGIAPEIHTFRFTSSCKDFEASANIILCSQYMGTLACVSVWPARSKALHELCPTSPSHLFLFHSAPDRAAPASQAFLFKGSKACLASGYLHLQSFLFLKKSTFTGVQSVYNIVLVSTVQQNESVMHTHICPSYLVAKSCLTLL